MLFKKDSHQLIGASSNWPNLTGILIEWRIFRAHSFCNYIISRVCKEKSYALSWDDAPAENCFCPHIWNFLRRGAGISIDLLAISWCPITSISMKLETEINDWSRFPFIFGWTIVHAFSDVFLNQSRTSSVPRPSWECGGLVLYMHLVLSHTYWNYFISDQHETHLFNQCSRKELAVKSNL